MRLKNTFVAMCALMLLLTGCKPKQAAEIDIKIGTPRAEVIEVLGEPVGFLSGLYGDIFEVNGSKIVVYYDTRTDSDVVVSEVKIMDESK